MKLFYIISMLGILFFSSCGGPKENISNEKEVSLPTDLFSKVEGDALSVTKAKFLKPGQDVILKGKIMGNLHPFVDNRASFIIGDPEKITSCELMGGEDHCKTPWDACCESKQVKKESTLNIQVVDNEGKVLKTGLRGKGGLDMLSHILVKGEVAPGSTQESTVINAHKIELMSSKL